MNLKTSALMSVYINEKAEYLDLSLRSILIDQTKIPDEFVLVCDGPVSSKIDEVINKYAQQFPEIFCVWRLENNQGLGEALNYGLSKCSNEIIIRADSDDVCERDRIQIQVDFLEAHPEIAIVSSYIDEFETDWEKPKNIKKLPLTNKDLVKMARFRNPINHMAVAFRKEAIIAAGSYNSIPYVEDYELWVRAIAHGYQLANINKVLVHARVGNGMILRRSSKKYISSWKRLDLYMLENGMITTLQYIRNMVAVRLFVYMPLQLKEFVYSTVLRQKNIEPQGKTL